MKNLLEESMQFITKNPKAKSDEIPERLRTFWLEENEINTEDGPSPVIPFMYALLYYKKKKGLTRFEITPEELKELYGSWLTILALAEVSERTDMKIEPIEIFNFDDYPKFKISIK